MEARFEDLDQTIPQRMPLLDRWVEPRRAAAPLAGVTALFLQHQLGNQLPQARAMLELGLDPRRLFWMDVPYTSNATVREALVGLGIPRGNLLVHDLRVLQAYAPYQRRRVERFLRDLLDAPPERVLVLDDGAYFLEAAACFRRRLPRVAVVEQTTRGVIKVESGASLAEYADQVPVVNVARSTPKTTLEPPFIGTAVCAALRRRLGSRFSSNHAGRCLVTGFGAIGAQVARFAVSSLGFAPGRIHVFDPDPGRAHAAAAAGYAPWRREERGTRFDLVIGCSGRSSFGVHDYVYLEDGAVLASASSGSVELSREDFIELADSSEFDDIEIVRDGLDETRLHSDLRFRLVDREATFVNAGFPVNFDGRVNCVPTHFMQATATMMVAAGVQAVAATTPGLLDLDPGFCRWVDREFRAELGEDAAVLTPATP